MKKEFENILTVPYRICPLGAHVDHQKGVVHGMAIDKGVTLTFSKAENIVRINSGNFAGEIEFSLSQPISKSNNWGDYAKSALFALTDNGYKIKYGFEGYISGELPAGGLSSSAAVIISYLRAFCILNNITLSESKLISLAHKAETQFIGLNCGTLDQSCEVICKKNSLLVLDTLDASYKNIAFPHNMPKFEIAVIFSGLEHALVSSKYNLRTDELKAAAYAIKAYSGDNYGRMENCVLRDISCETYMKYNSHLPDNFRKRCEHYYSEQQRVAEGTKLFKEGNLIEYGKLMTQSGDSSINNYEAGSPELKAIHEIMKNTDGIYGGRFSGAGFKGCCIAFIDTKYKEIISEKITTEYLKLFPNLKEKFSISFCKTADGCGEI